MVFVLFAVQLNPVFSRAASLTRLGKANVRAQASLKQNVG
jgi:hypothetical protein